MIKSYLQNPLILSPAKPCKSFLLYLSMSANYVGCMLAQEGEERRSKKAIYYLSLRMMGCELKYTD